MLAWSRDVFRTQSNIYDRAFSEIWLTAFFVEKAKVGVQVGSKYAYVKVDLIPWETKSVKKQKGSSICATELSVFLTINTSWMFSRRVSFLLIKVLLNQ